MSTVLVIFGTRPEAIKMAPVIAELRRRGDPFRTIVCNTGQHREMLQPVLTLFDVAVDADLQVMQPGQSLAELTARLLTGLDELLARARPDWVLAQGDTTTALAAALAAFYRRIPLGHVEAGLRTGDLRRPFPEELNRRIADLAADLYFAPTERARQALLAEGVPDAAIHVTGNTVIDALLDVAARPFDWWASPLADVPRDQPLVLVTAHRRESLGEPLVQLCEAIGELAQRFASAGVQFVWPVHLNPEVRQPVERLLAGVDNVRLIEPLDYLATVHAMRQATLILTDSGGIQEEAPSLKVPVLVMRDVSERPEGIEAGVARLVGTDRQRIVAAASELLQNPDARRRMASGINPYGDGQASRRIVDALACGRRC